MASSFFCGNRWCRSHLHTERKVWAMDAVDRMIEAVKSCGIKQNHIARLAGMSATKLNKIVKRKQVPTVPDLIDIAHAIDLDPARLFTEGELVIQLEALRSA